MTEWRSVRDGDNELGGVSCEQRYNPGCTTCSAPPLALHSLSHCHLR